MFKKSIPNIFTALNLCSGLIASVMALSDRLEWAAYFVFLGIFFDFFDGFFARKFNVEGELGKQLDSLADMVTSGVVPGLVMFQLLFYSLNGQWFMDYHKDMTGLYDMHLTISQLIPYIAFLIPIGAAFRLAKFNIDDRQTVNFIGLPTPALSTLIVSLPLILIYGGSVVQPYMLKSWILIVITLIGCYLMNAEIELFSLKFKDYRWRDNQIKYSFLICCLILLLVLNVLAIPLIIILYVCISIMTNYRKRKRLL